MWHPSHWPEQTKTFEVEVQPVANRCKRRTKVKYTLHSQQFLKAHLQHFVLKNAFNFSSKSPKHAITNQMTWVQRMDWYPGNKEKPNYDMIMCFQSKCTWAPYKPIHGPWYGHLSTGSGPLQIYLAPLDQLSVANLQIWAQPWTVRKTYMFEFWHLK
jgi:hypothetical protein